MNWDLIVLLLCLSDLKSKRRKRMAEESKIYRFMDEEITAPADMDVEEVRRVWEDCHASIANAEVIENPDGSITFALRGGSKG
jgi:hypothetical protein